MAHITLIGTVHRDPQGEKKLANLLEQLQPDLITLEFSHYGFRFRQRHRSLLRRKVLSTLTTLGGAECMPLSALKVYCSSSGIGGLLAFLDFPFEYKAASHFSKRGGSSLALLDNSASSRQHLAALPHLLSRNNLTSLAHHEQTPLRTVVEIHYRLARYVLTHHFSPKIQKHLPTPRQRQRDLGMARRLTRLAIGYPARHVVHIGGWEHLCFAEPSLFFYLQALKPTRLLLDDHFLQGIPFPRSA